MTYEEKPILGAPGGATTATTATKLTRVRTLNGDVLYVDLREVIAATPHKFNSNDPRSVLNGQAALTFWTRNGISWVLADTPVNRGHLGVPVIDMPI